MSSFVDFAANEDVERIQPVGSTDLSYLVRLKKQNHDRFYKANWTSVFFLVHKPEAPGPNPAHRII